jgi:SAM-dependent methyltransferase
MPSSDWTDDGRCSADQYGPIAIDYATSIAGNSYNAYYERPNTLSLLGDVTGLRVLDVGCGPGLLTAWLVEHGAVVTAFDVSETMTDLARKTAGNQAHILVADLGRPLWFANDHSFDLIVASLVLHYVRDWEHVFREFRRVLTPDGAVVFSTHHPTMDWVHTPDDYFAIVQVSETWFRGSRDFEVTFWRRPLTAMTEAITRAGFLIDRLVEPQPIPELRDLDPAAYDKIRTKPRFLFFRLRLGLP